MSREAIQHGLDIVVVGAGLGGLAAAGGLRAAGHRVVVLEQAPSIGEVGAGIQMAPNASRILLGWGLRDRLAEVAVRAEKTVRLRWENGAVLGSNPLGAAVEDRYGAPYWHIHRADLHAALMTTALDPSAPGQPAELLLDSRVESIVGMPAAPGDAVPDRAIATLANGRTVEGDVLIGADGIHSTVRRELSLVEESRFSGDHAWRATIPAARLAEHPELNWITQTPAVTVWLGPSRHLVHYLVRAGQLVNIVAIVPGDPGGRESWMQPGDPADMVRAFEGWDPRTRQLLSLADTATRSPMFDREPLPHWVSGRVALLGDACHAMLPYQAQGAGQAFEDAQALVEALSGVGSRHVPAALERYQKVRIGRATAVQAASRANRVSFHLPDGPAQQARDMAMAAFTGDSLVSFDWLWSGSIDPVLPHA